MPKIKLTTESVKRLQHTGRDADGRVQQVLYRDTDLAGFGLRVGADSKVFFVEKRVEGRTVRHTLGRFGALTVEQARKAAQIKLGEMTGGADPNAERKAARAAAAAAQRAADAAASHTLKSLCEWYVKHQTAAGKESARDAAWAFKRYVESSQFADIPAKDFTPQQATALIRGVVEAGHTRTAAKLRAYLRAAYALAQGAETNAQAPAALVLFGVQSNPIASTSAIKGANAARSVTLNDVELGEVVRVLRERRAVRYDDALAALELSLWLGGQRLAQVLRINPADIDQKGRTITLLDPKGRREKARRHVLPLSDDALALVQQILAVRGSAEHLFGGSKPTSPDTVARKGVEVLAEAQAAIAKRRAKAGGKAEKRPALEPRDLRRTAETMLAAMGISKDTRAQLLSHGLGGVQDRHYDQHDYMSEKRAALTAWAERLNALAEHRAIASNVQQLRQLA